MLFSALRVINCLRVILLGRMSDLCTWELLLGSLKQRDLYGLLLDFRAVRQNNMISIFGIIILGGL